MAAKKPDDYFCMKCGAKRGLVICYGCHLYVCPKCVEKQLCPECVREKPLWDKMKNIDLSKKSRKK